MNLVPLRTAVIAGTCAVALSFTTVPAFAVVSTAAGSSSCTAAGTSSDDTSSEDTSADDPGSTDDGPVAASDGSAPGDTTPIVSPAYRADDDSGDSADTDDTCAGDDDGTDDSGSTAPVVVAPLPAEQGTPKASYSDTVFTPKAIRSRGIRVVYSGLTAGAEYQPFFFVPGRFGDSYGRALTASKKGTVTVRFAWKKVQPSFLELGAVYDIGLRGVDTELNLTREITVKYDSDLIWHAAERHGRKVVLSVSVDRDGAKGTSSDWKKVPVAFQKKVGTRWVTVKTVRTNGKGVARTRITAGVSAWRAVVAGSGTVVGATSAGHRK